MKRILVGSLLGFLSLQAGAAEYVKVDMKLKINGELKASPRVLVNDRKTATISQVNEAGRGTEFEVTPDLKPVDGKHADAVSLDIKIYAVEPGARRLIGTLHALTRNGHEVSLTQEGLQRLELSVLPSVQPLSAR